MKEELYLKIYDLGQPNDQSHKPARCHDEIFCNEVALIFLFNKSFVRILELIGSRIMEPWTVRTLSTVEILQ